MEASFEFEVEERKTTGTRAARRLRREMKIPAVLYGGGEAPVQLLLGKNQVDKNLQQEAVYSHILTLKLPGSKVVQAILKEVQRHPSKEAILHLDFQRVKADEVIHVRVPLHFMGEDKSVGVKKGGIVVRNMTDVEVSCLPGNLPEFIEVDLTNVDIGETIHLSDLKVPEGVTIIEAHEEGQDPAVVMIQAPISEQQLEASLGEGEEEPGEGAGPEEEEE